MTATYRLLLIRDTIPTQRRARAVVMASLIDHRRETLARRLDHMRERGEWHSFQTFVLGLLPHDGYTGVRLSNVKNDFGRDGVARTPDGKPCVVAVSFDCSLPKIRKDAQRWTQDPNREPAAVMLFVTNDAPVNTTVSDWVAEVARDFKLELRLYNRETIQATATRQGVWPQTRDELGIIGGRPGYVCVSPYDSDAVRQALRARPPEWLSQRVELPEWAELAGSLRSRLIFGKPGAGKTTTLFEILERNRPETVLVAQGDLREASQIEALLCDADEVFLTNSSFEVLPVTRVERKPIAGESPGQLTNDLRVWFRAAIRQETADRSF